MLLPRPFQVVLLVYFNEQYYVLKTSLILERPGTIKNYKYYQNDEIRLKTISTNTIYYGKITAVNDSSIVVGYANEIFLSDITKIYTFQWGFIFYASWVLGQELCF